MLMAAEGGNRFGLRRGMLLGFEWNCAVGIALQLGALRIVNRGILLLVPLLHLIHVAVAALLGQHRRAMHQLLLGLDEVLAIETPDARMHIGVHADGVARAG